MKGATDYPVESCTVESLILYGHELYFTVLFGTLSWEKTQQYSAQPSSLSKTQVTQGMGDLTVTSSEAINTSTSPHNCVKDRHQIHSILGQNIQEDPPSPTTHPQPSGLVKRKHKVALSSLKRPSRSRQERVVIKLLLHYKHKKKWYISILLMYHVIYSSH